MVLGRPAAADQPAPRSRGRCRGGVSPAERTGIVVSFREWLDDQHNVRRAVDTETGGLVTVTTINVTAIDQPLQITLPPEPKLPGS